MANREKMALVLRSLEKEIAKYILLSRAYITVASSGMRCPSISASDDDAVKLAKQYQIRLENARLAMSDAKYAMKREYAYWGGQGSEYLPKPLDEYIRRVREQGVGVEGCNGTLLGNYEEHGRDG